LPFINRHSYHSVGLSSSDIRQLRGDFESLSPLDGRVARNDSLAAAFNFAEHGAKDAMNPIPVKIVLFVTRGLAYN
jgi:hypothetical protein